MVATSNGRRALATSPAPVARTYSVKSLTVAAALRCAGATYLGPSLRPDGWVVFRFDNADGGVPQLIGQYWDGALPEVQPRDLLGALGELRAEIHALKTAKEADRGE